MGYVDKLTHKGEWNRVLSGRSSKAVEMVRLQAKQGNIRLQNVLGFTTDQLKFLISQGYLKRGWRGRGYEIVRGKF